MAASTLIGAARGRRIAVVNGGGVDASTPPRATTPTVDAAEAESPAVGETASTGIDHPFRELDDLVLHLKGLVLVSDLRRERGAAADELEMYRGEIDRARQTLARFALEGSLPGVS